MKNNNIIFGIICIIIIQMLASCSGSIEVVKNRSYKKATSRINNIIFIDPDFTEIDNRKRELSNIVIRNDEMKNTIVECIVNSSKNCKLSARVIYDKNIDVNDVDYFNYLVPLKQTMLYNHFLQLKIDRNASNAIFKNIAKQQVNYQDKISQFDIENTLLEKKYGTKYFATCGFYSKINKMPLLARMIQFVFYPPKAFQSGFTKSYYYVIISDVKTAEVVYSEIREFDSRLDKESISAILFDSFKILNNTYKK